MEQTEKAKMPERKISVKIKENNYDIDFPTTGGLMEIEVLKAQLSRGQYNEIASSGTVNGAYSRLLIDMIATFSVLMPQLKKDLKVSTFSELQAIDSKVLLQVYVNTVSPWLKSWFDVLNSDDTETAAPKDDK